MTAEVTGASKRLPDATHELFKGGSECVTDASRYPSRHEVNDLFTNAQANVLEALQAFPDSKWNDPTSDNFPTDFFPTLGSVWAMMGTHPFWHLGQLTACRVAMGKKPMFS